MYTSLCEGRGLSFCGLSFVDGEDWRITISLLSRHWAYTPAFVHPLNSAWNSTKVILTSVSPAGVGTDQLCAARTSPGVGEDESSSPPSTAALESLAMTAFRLSLGEKCGVASGDWLLRSVPFLQPILFLCVCEVSRGAGVCGGPLALGHGRLRRRRDFVAQMPAIFVQCTIMSAILRSTGPRARVLKFTCWFCCDEYQEEIVSTVCALSGG